MLTLLLYATPGGSGFASVANGVERVESRFATRWPAGWVRHGCDLASGGLYLWDVEDAECLWPAWSEDAEAVVATLHVPLGYQRLIGDLTPQRSPQPLARSLMQAPEGIFELTPPTVLARLDKADDRVDLWTDALGIGRMFQLQTSEGWVWSNRPEVACLFAGLPSRPDPMGWRYHAATDWFMGETSPIEGVKALPAATHITSSARHTHPVISHLDPSAVYADSGRLDFESVAEALQNTARSVAAIWPAVPTLDITGGRDSRVVAAAFLSAGIEVRLHTHNAVPGEVEAAQHLVGLLDQPVPHDMSQSSSWRGGAQPVVVAEHVHGWHRYSGGLRPSSYLAHRPPATLHAPSMPVVGGAGGEVAHGYYYPPGVLEIDALPLTERLPAYREYLMQRLVGFAGANEAARAEAAAQIDRVLRTGLSLGLSDARLLDYFYADERLRRWGTTGERQGVISPLLTPAFIRSAFALRPQQKLEAALHKGVLKHLIPPWADVPFFQPPPAARAVTVAGTPPANVSPAGIAGSPGAPVAVKAPLAPFRLGLAVDADRLEAVFALPSRWVADMDHVLVADFWTASKAGTSTARQEMALWRVVWRDLFHDHLAETLGGSAEPREALPAPPEPAVVAAPVIEAATLLDCEPVKSRPRPPPKGLIRRAARTRAGRALRRSRLGGELFDK